MAIRRKGRRKGSKNRGFYYRKARDCWYRKEGKKFIHLLDESGQRIRGKAESEAAKLAHARWFTDKKKPIVVEPSGSTVLEVCQAYLAKAREEAGENKTFTDRSESLFDFCFGLPAKCRAS